MIILASASPRRRELLEQIGCCFSVEVSESEEIMKGKIPPAEIAVMNARSKAAAVACRNKDKAVLGADTIVVCDGLVLGKPRDEAEACRFLQLLSGRQHQVITGIALHTAGKVFTRAVTTDVYFTDLKQETIKRYVATGEPMDKAGAYAIQGRAAAFVIKINGSFSNVVGLPLQAVVELAGLAGVDIYADGA